jgi:hypothetical protein
MTARQIHSSFRQSGTPSCIALVAAWALNYIERNRPSASFSLLPVFLSVRCVRQAAFHVRDACQENGVMLMVVVALEDELVPMMTPRSVLQ